MGSVGLTETESTRPPTPGSPSDSQVEPRSLGVVVVVVLVPVVWAGAGVGVVAPGEVTPRVGGAVVVGAGAPGAVAVGVGSEGGVEVGVVGGPDGIVVVGPDGVVVVGACFLGVGGVALVLVFGFVGLALARLRGLAQRADLRRLAVVRFVVRLFACEPAVLDLAAFGMAPRRLAGRRFAVRDLPACDCVVVGRGLEAGQVGVRRDGLRAGRACRGVAEWAGRALLAAAVAAHAHAIAAAEASSASVMYRTLPTCYMSAHGDGSPGPLHRKMDECPRSASDL